MPNKRPLLPVEDQIKKALQSPGDRLYLRGANKLPGSIAQLTHVNELIIDGESLDDLSALQALTHLKHLDILRSKVIDLNPIGSLLNLKHFSIKSQETIAANPLAKLSSLESIYVNAHEIKNWSSLEALRNLESLSLLATMPLGDLGALPRISRLKSLRLSCIDLPDLSPLASCKGLFSLSLFSAQSMNLAPLANLTNLEYLILSGGPISDISPISTLHNLSDLIIQARCQNLEPLADLTKLQNLDIRQTGAKDLAPLARLVGLMVGTQNDPISGGLSFNSTSVLDPFIRSIGRRGRVERVRMVLEYLRRRAGLSTLSEATAEWLKDSAFESHWEAIVSRIPPSAVGAKFVTAGDKLSIDSSGEASDQEAADSPLTRDLHEGVNRRAAQFSTIANRLDNQFGWRGIGDAAQRFSDAVNRPTSEIPNVIGKTYESLIELGSFLEFDNRIREAREENATPLDLEVQRAFKDLIRTAAPWVRQFPSARKLDDEAGAFLSNRQLYEPSRAVALGARDAELISSADSATIQHLLEAANRGEFQGEKAGNRGTGTARNLTLKTMGLVAAFYSGAVSSDFATKSLLVQRAGTFLANSESAILPLFADLPADIQQALRLMLDDIHRSQFPLRPTAPSEMFDRRRKPDDDDDQE